MPKDPNRNQPNYKIGGSHINEYEYDHNKGAITQEEEQMPRDKNLKHRGEAAGERHDTGHAGGPSSGKNG